MGINKLSAGKKAPEEVNVFIEIPQGVCVKYELYLFQTWFEQH